MPNKNSGCLSIFIFLWALFAIVIVYDLTNGPPIVKEKTSNQEIYDELRSYEIKQLEKNRAAYEQLKEFDRIEAERNRAAYEELARH